MKKSEHILICAVAVFTVAFGGFSQTADKTEEAITLPDVTTVITGGAVTAGKDTVPDFRDVLPDEKGEGTVLPELPDVSTPENKRADQAYLKPEQEKSVYAEGLVGGGFPGFFTGVFSLYRTSGDNPFRIGFSHESVNGYAHNSYSDGYFDRTTAISGEKTFSVKNMVMKFTGGYDSVGNGLQNQTAGIYDVTKQSLSGGADINWKLPHSFYITANADGGWYNRFAGITGTPVVEDFSKSVSVAMVSPVIGFGWYNYGFSTGFSARWSLEADADDTLSGGASNRGEFGVNFGWKNSNVNIYSNAAAVIGSKIGDNSVLVPFTLGISAAFTTPLSPRMFTLTAEGGMSSYKPDCCELETKYTFSSLSFIPEETSDWYGTLSFDVPIKDIFTVDLNSEFRTTAAENGVWEPDYDGTAVSGQYVYVQDNRTIFRTGAGIAMHKEIITLRGAWNAHWADVPVLEDQNSVIVAVSLQGAESRWGTDVSSVFFPGADDAVPKLDVSAFFRLTPAVRLAVTGSDVVKLCSGCSRTYAGQYITRSGTAGILVKFFF